MAVTSVDVGRRIKFWRESRGLTQEALGTKVGFRDRQTLSDIEAGKRQIAADELVLIARGIRVDLESLLDPFLLVGEGRFNFRANKASAREINTFEGIAGNWIAAYRELSRQAGLEPDRFGTKLELDVHSSFEDAEASADALRSRWNLGRVPAVALQAAIERELGALVLYVDAPARISGAALHLPGLQTVLVNRGEGPARRLFDLAHELFHLLTWDAMTPARVEPIETVATKGNRIEQLANKFAAAVLIPGDVLSQRWIARGSSAFDDWSVGTAREFMVSPEALQWRLVGLGLLSKDKVKKAKATRDESQTSPPPLFSAEFVGRFHEAVEGGRLSMRRAASLLGLSLTAFAELCRNYGRPLSYDS